jgi:hypothetical protein
MDIEGQMEVLTQIASKYSAPATAWMEIESDHA